MRVLLVSANREHLPDPIFPLGLSYIAAAASRAGHEIDVADLCFGSHPLEELRAQVAHFQPDVIGLSLRNVDNAAYPLTVDYLGLHREVIDILHTASSAPVVLGGSGFSIMPQAYMFELDGDWGIAGEGERAFVDLLQALEQGLDPSAIAGVVSPAAKPETSPGLPILPQRPLNWAEQLRPLRDPFDYARYIRRGGTGNIQTKRGCVFKCSYCTYPLLEGNRFRARDAADVVDEIEKLQRDYGPHPIFFVDSILNFPRGHVEAICEEILRRKLNLRWSCYATPIKLDRHQAQLMAAAGCEGIELGTDAVDDEQLTRLGKSFDAEIAQRANRYCMEAGLKVCQTIIFGAPGETQDSVRATCRALRKMKPTAVVAMTGVRLYPGTPLTMSLIKEGKVTTDEIGLLPTFYIDPAVADFLPVFLQQQAYETGNWVLPGLVEPIQPASQRLLRKLGVAGPLWRLFHKPWMQWFYRSNFKRPNTSWGVPNASKKVV
ncbi:MAG: B12-binding domain-containing radical SAM protein [Gammaproteobacteria bacterium]|nr:MAG: B12-binding domain-containing radical SAM protein [Gammaproteobacteria bacterium]